MNTRTALTLLAPCVLICPVACSTAEEIQVLTSAKAGASERSATGNSGGAAPASVDRELCKYGGYCDTVTVSSKDTLDLLFVVDNSVSMRDEQARLRAEFPRMIEALVMGRTPGGREFPAAKSLHLGVVSTDMGVGGTPSNHPGCNSPRHLNGGDDGLLQHAASGGVAGCSGNYPAFLELLPNLSDPAQTAIDFGCMASLGTAGCGFEQQLEAGLKALWPRMYIDAEGTVYPPGQNPILFLSPTPEGRYGHGDVPVALGGNGGFLRNDPTQGLSIIAVVIVTDEEDCSSRNTAHFAATNDPADPLSKQGMNLRCYYNQKNLFEVKRYVEGFKSLRPGNEELVVFGAIAGVPPDLVDATARQGGDSLDAYYEAMLGAEAMQYRLDDDEQNLRPSCVSSATGAEPGNAYPPRRIVEVAKEFGENGFVASICQDFAPATDQLLEVLSRRLGASCLPRALQRETDGKVRCDVIWQLPAPGQAPESSPTACDARQFLEPIGAGRPTRNARGGENCRVKQLAVTEDAIPRGQGYFYDNFSLEASACRDGRFQRIGFTDEAKPPLGVEVAIDCAEGAMP